MKLNTDEDINIKQILMNNSEPRFVEFYSHKDNRNHIMNAAKFCDVFGYSIEELILMYDGECNTNKVKP